VSGSKGVLNTERRVLHMILAVSFSLKYIDLDKKHYLRLHTFVYRDVLSLDRQYAENDEGLE
jgi:hypothetical protein